MAGQTDPAPKKRRFDGRGTELLLLAGIVALTVTFSVAYGVTAGYGCACGALAGVMAMLILRVRDEERDRA